MYTLTLEHPGRFLAHRTPEPPPPGPGEALVEVRRIGICGTDLHAYRGRQPFFSYPRILGHELGVEVLAIGGEDAPIQVGDRCAVEPYLHCGSCIACRKGKTNCCERLQVMGVHVDGGMRERIIVPVDKLHPSSILPLDELAVVEMLCIGAHAARRAVVEAGEDVLVIGAGPIGLSVMAFVGMAGGRVVGLEVRSDRREFAQRVLGIDRWVEPGERAVESLRGLCGGGLPTLVLDATGHAGSMMEAVHFVAHGGRLVYVGLFVGDVTFHDPLFHSREMTLLGSRNATGEDFRFVIRTLEEGRLDVAPWITHRVPFDDVPEAFPGLHDPQAGVVKAEIER